MYDIIGCYYYLLTNFETNQAASEYIRVVNSITFYEMGEMLLKIEFWIHKIHILGCSEYEVQAGYGAKRNFQTVCLA